MGYLNNSTVTVDAILTKKGRELLARGRDEFQITKFALADDEIDYDLYNPDHPLGTAYYGAAIENMPITEALPDETQMLKYKLMTLPKGLGDNGRVPIIDVVVPSGQLRYGQKYTVNPTTRNFASANEGLGYTFILSDSDVADLETLSTVFAAGGPSLSNSVSAYESARSLTQIARSVAIVPKVNLISNASATLTIIGNETGGRATISFTVKKFDGSAPQTLISRS